MIRRIGPHVVKVEDDLVTLRFYGECSAEHMRGITGTIDEVIALCGCCAVVGDLRELRSVSPEARRFASSWTNIDFCYAVAVFGASLPLRTIVTLLSRAIELFRKRPNTSGVEFFKTEEEARASVVPKRREFLAR
jgi:hypothetical protein